VEGVTTGFPTQPGARFESIAQGGGAAAGHLLFMGLTVGIVMVGIRKGIERAAMILMPTPFLIVLSLGMGATITFASYLDRSTDLNQGSVTISFANFGVACTAGLVVFPVIFALGLQDQVSESTVHPILRGSS